jgi:CheY-like chemotaxis protein
MKEEAVTRKTFEANVKILVATDNSSDANLIRKLLEPEFDHVFSSVDPDLAVQDFESRAPDIMVLAFNTLEKSESFYLGLYRLSTKIHLQPHRTIILCRKEEVNHAYKACRKEYFDDYVMFWPANNDAPRLLMAVHHALRDLLAIKDDQPSPVQFAAQARNLAQMENLIDQQMEQGGQRIDMANRAMKQVEVDIGAVFDNFSSKLAHGEIPNISGNSDIAAMMREMQKMTQDEIGSRLHTVTDSMQRIMQWANEFKTEFVPHVESARSLNAMADRVQPTILVVDDDDFQSKITKEYLTTGKYRVLLASGGVEALNVLRKVRPDLILMDIMMPVLGGIEATRRLKAMPAHANTPVIMVTGQSEGGLVRDSIMAGAVNFVVKPFDAETLLAKVASALRQSPTQGAGKEPTS